MYREFQQNDPDPPSTGRETPWQAVATAATLQGVAHMLYAGALMLTFLIFVLSMSNSSGRGERGDGFQIVVGIVTAGVLLALSANWIVGVVAGAMMAMADAGGRARGVGLGLMACTALVLINAPSLGFFFMIFDRGMGPFGDFDRFNPWGSAVTLVFMGLSEWMRLSLVGFYACVAGSAMGKRSLANSGQLVGVLTPVVLAVLAAFTILLMMVSDGPRSSMTREWIMPVMVAVNGGAQVLLLLWGGMLMFRLAGASGQSSRGED